MSETKPCRCGQKMILLRSNVVLTSNPPQYPHYWWCGGCYNQEAGPTVMGKTEDEVLRAQWEKAQIEIEKHELPEKLDCIEQIHSQHVYDPHDFQKKINEIIDYLEKKNDQGN